MYIYIYITASWLNNPETYRVDGHTKSRCVLIYQGRPVPSSHRPIPRASWNDPPGNDPMFDQPLKSPFIVDFPIENGDFPLNMLIFHSYISLPLKNTLVWSARECWGPSGQVFWPNQTNHMQKAPTDPWLIGHHILWCCGAAMHLDRTRTSLLQSQPLNPSI